MEWIEVGTKKLVKDIEDIEDDWMQLAFIASMQAIFDLEACQPSSRQEEDDRQYAIYEAYHTLTAEIHEHSLTSLPPSRYTLHHDEEPDYEWWNDVDRGR